MEDQIFYLKKDPFEMIFDHLEPSQIIASYNECSHEEGSLHAARNSDFLS